MLQLPSPLLCHIVPGNFHCAVYLRTDISTRLIKNKNITI